MAHYEEMPWEYPNEYERAICYYTLPKVVHPLTYGLILAYAVCLFEAFAALCVGVILENSTVTLVGVVAVATIVLFGCFAFSIRALMNEVKMKKALRAAAHTPAPTAPSSEFPTPFDTHCLYKWAPRYPNRLYRCQEGEAELSHRIEKAPGKFARHLLPEATGEAPILIEGKKGLASFSFGAGLPKVLHLKQGDALLARLFTPRLFQRDIRIELAGAAEAAYRIREHGVYHAGRLVGRSYVLRGARYLDVECAHAHPAVLTWFLVDTTG